MKMLYFCHIKAIFDTTCHVSKPRREGKLERVPFLALAMILNHFVPYPPPLPPTTYHHLTDALCHRNHCTTIPKCI